MIPKKYQRKPESWWLKEPVITTRTLANQLQLTPAGTVCTVVRKYGGLSLYTDRCHRCGRAVRMTRVSYEDLTLVDDVLETERDKAVERMQKEASLGQSMGILAWDGRYLVLPADIVSESPLETVLLAVFSESPEN